MDMMTLAMAKSYTDSQRLAYEETVVEKRADFVVPAGQGGYDGSEMVIDAPFAIEVGQLYFVTINGKTFETYGGEDNRGRYIKIVENDAPVFEAYFEAPRFSVLAVDPNGQGSEVDRCVVIETREPVIHDIDPKYLPVGGVGYEEARPKLADFVMPAGTGGSSSAYIKAPFLFSEGDNREKTYYITVNGKTYELTGKMGETFAIGDYNLENEPHLYIEEYADYGLWNVYVYDPNGLTDMVDRHIVIETGEVTIHTIDPKYLPIGGVCHEETVVKPMLDVTIEAGDGSVQVIAPFSLAEVVTSSNTKEYPVTINGVSFTATANQEYSGYYTIGGFHDGKLVFHITEESIDNPGFWTVVALDPNTKDASVDRHVIIDTLIEEDAVLITEVSAFGSACMPVVYAEHMVSNRRFDSATSKFLNEAAKNKMPIIIKYKREDGRYYSGVAYYCTSSNNNVYFRFNCTDHFVVITAQDDGTWDYYTNTFA